MDKALPLFRKDLRVIRGPDDPDGAPTYNIYDPIRSQFFKISWKDSLILRYSHPSITLENLIKQIENNTSVKLDPLEIQQFFFEAQKLNLLALPKTSEMVTKEAEIFAFKPFQWLLFHYLYFRIPVINPDQFLKKTLHYVRPLASTTAFYIYGMAALLGFVLMFRRFDEYLNTFSYFFNLQGIVSYAIAIISVKFIHEFSHAYTAKYYGTRVPTMGVLFMVLWPALYTDVTDGWRLKSRKKRLAISLAGLIAEIIVAGFATLGWALSEPGLFQSVFFVVSSSSLITSLAININPAMRFDGYYILCDLWGIDNLQNRAFNMTRWKLREVFLGLKVPPPEEVSPKRLYGMIVYSIYTWIYRLILYAGIAIFVYFAFTKALGIFLFLLEIGVFIIWPLAWEIQELYKMRSFLTFNPRLLGTLIGLSLLSLWIILPWPHMRSFSAIASPGIEQWVYIPGPGIVKSISVKRGETVKEGDALISIDSKKLQTQILDLEKKKEMIQKTIQTLSLDDKAKTEIPEKEEQLLGAENELKAAQELNKKMDLKALLNGVVFQWDDLLYPGRGVQQGQLIGKIADLKKLQVIAFVPDAEIKHYQIGQEATFYPKNSRDGFKGKVIDINPIWSENLRFPALASVYGGDLPVEASNDRYKLMEIYYPVLIDLDNAKQLRAGQTGTLEMRGPWESYAFKLYRFFLKLFWRESSL